MACGIGRGIVQIPNPAVHSGICRQRAERTQPVEGDELFLQFRLGDVGFVGAGEFANELAVCVENFESHGSRGGVSEVVIDDRAVGRIGGSGFVGRKRRVSVGVALNPVGGRWSKKMGVGGSERSGGFAQRGDVIQNPERAAVRGYDEVVVVNPQIAHGGVGQIQLQGLPMIAVVERDPDCVLRAGKQQPFAHGIFADCIDRTDFRQAGGDQLPCLTAVVRAVNVGLLVVDAEAAHGGVGGVVIEVRGADLRDFAPGRQFFGSNVIPLLAAVASLPDQAVVGARPERVDVLE